MVLICPKVERATIFFKSVSNNALNPDKHNVQEENKHKTKHNKLNELIKLENRINKKAPAVTKVDEWTKAETGVGAAIAAGNQTENGHWALFVIAARIINKQTKIISLETCIIGNQFESLKRKIEISKKTSPNRFEIAVVNLPPTARGER